MTTSSMILINYSFLLLLKIFKDNSRAEHSKTIIQLHRKHMKLINIKIVLTMFNKFYRKKV